MADFIFTEHASNYLSTNRTVMASIVKYLFLAFSNNVSSAETGGTKLYLLIYLPPFLTNLQLLSFIFSPHLNEEGYEGYESYIKIFTLMRFDALSFYFGIEFPFFIFSCFIIILPLSAIIIQTLRLKYNKKPPQKSVIRFTVKIPLVIIKRFLLPSICCVFISHIKYSLFSYSSVKEYEGVTIYQLNSIPLALISIILLPLFYIIILAQTLFLYENDLTRAKESFFARSSSHVALINISFYFILSVLYFFVREYGLWYFVIAFGVLKVYNLYQYIYHLPFYQKFANILYGWSCFLNAWSSLVLVISVLLESPLVCMFLIVIVTPCFLVILHMLTDMRIKYIATHYKIETCRTIYQAELLIRQSLKKALKYRKIDEEIYENAVTEVKTLFTQASSKFDNEKLLHVWEAIFYYQILKKPDLALVKLSRSGGGNTSLEGDFHTHRLKRKLLKNIRFSKDRQFISFLRTISEVKDADLKACNYALDFCNELLSAKPNQKTLELLAFSLSKSNIEVTKIYDKLITKFPKQGAVIKLYGSYLNDVVNDPRGEEMLKSFKNLGLEDVIEEYFEYKWGLLVVAGETDKVGMILHSNKQAAEIINLPIRQIIGSSLRNYIPPPINKFHLCSMKNYIMYGSSNEVSHNDYALFYNKDKFLVECMMFVKTACWADRPFFIANLKKCEGNREIVLYDPDNFKIHGTSRGFRNLVDNQGMSNFEGCYLEEFLPGIKELKTEKQNFQRFKYKVHNGRPVYLMFGSTTISHYTFHYLHIFDKVSETVVIIKDIHSPLDNTSFSSSRLSEDMALLSKDDEDINLIKHVDFTSFKAEFSPRSTQVFSQPTETLSANVWRDSERKIETITSNKTIQTTNLQAGSSMIERMSFVIMNKLKGATRRYSIFLLLITFIMIATCFSNVIILYDFFEKDYNYDNLKTIIYQRNNLSEIVRAVRSLELYNAGFISNDDYYKSITAELNTLMKEFNSNYLEIKDNADEISDGVDNDMFFNDVLPIYKLINGEIKESRMNIINVMNAIVFSLQNILTNHIELNANSSDFFFIYRNSPAEVLNALNITATQLEVKQLDQENDIIIKISLIAIVLAVLIGLLCVILLLPNIILMEQCNQQLWKSFNKIKLDMILQLRLKILQRLENLHGEEVACPEYSKDKRKNMPASKKCYKPLLYTILYLITSVAFIMLAFNLALQDFSKFLNSYPPYVNWLAMSVTSTEFNFYWLREECIQNTAESYFNIVSSGQFWSDPNDRLRNSTDNLDYILDTLISNPEDHGIYYLDHDNLNNFINSSCSSSTSCQDSLLRYGIRSGVYKYITMSQYLQLSSYTILDYEALLNMENIALELKKALKDNLELYYDFIDSQKTEFLNTFLYGTIGFSIFILLLVVFLLRPSVKQTSDKIQAIWHINKVFQLH